MSELNEDILNYEIGDVDDDTDLIGADEDELLLSDEETFPCRISQDQEDDLLSDGRTEKTSQSGESVKPKKSVDKPEKKENETKIEEGTETTTSSAICSEREQSPKSSQEESACIPSESDCVSSTNRSDDGECSFPIDCDKNASEKEATFDDKNSVLTFLEEDVQSLNQSETTDTKTESSVVSSQEVVKDSFNNGPQSTSEDLDADDSDDARERRNPKTCVEREAPQSGDETNRDRGNFQPFQRNRHPRASVPRHNNPMFPGIMKNDNFNQPPQFMSQYRGPRRPMAPGPQNDFMRNPNIPMMRGPAPHRMPMHGMPLHSNRLPGPPNLGLRPPFSGQPGMYPIMPPQGMMRPRIPAPNAHPMMPQTAPFTQFPPQGHPPNMRLPMPANTPIQHTQTGSINAAPIPNQPSQLPVPIAGARKVLINPNFKGGVQAATNQLMLDTMKNSKLMENTREAELLRQQEAFINQNRMHIEKRRRSREYSPERNHRDRERSRSYSPPRRRERDGRRPYTNFRDNRTRRPNSKDRDNIDSKQRRDGDGDGNNDKNSPKTEEDEETKAYRLKIEKQKAMREKIMRDKEMRRRKAVEGTKKEDEKKVVENEPLQKLTPIIVTEKKIISLKKKSTETNSDNNTMQKSKTVALTRKVTVASSEVSSQKTQAGSLLRAGSTIPNKKVRIEDEEFNEDELLADSPPLKSKIASKSGETDDKTTSSFGNRRVVVRNPNDASNVENINDKSSRSTKGIFDRLDKKVIGVNETAKRKIQRIVINNSSE